jgi:Predicted flavoproteins
LQDALHGSTAGAVKFIAGEYNLPRSFCKALLARQASEGSISPKRLAALLTSDEFRISEAGTFKTGMVTRGGIDRSEIDFKTMQLVHHPGLYAIGEIIDVDGISGGYNLQFAYSSAKTAAESIRLSSCLS